MKIVALEEHLITPDIAAAWRALGPAEQDLGVPLSTGGDIERRLLDLADVRLAAMDEAGVDVQVLSVSTPGVQTIDPARAVPVARAANDLIAATVGRRPDRFQGFATLPLGAPQEAARELERAVVELGLNGVMLFGRIGDRNLDHPDFRPVLETAAKLRAPIYLHPQSPPPGVRRAYYQGLGDKVEHLFGTAGIGWHYESGMQALRLVPSGTLDRLPDLRLILGHWGEVVLFYLERIEMLSQVVELDHPISEYFQRNVWVTPSGIFSQQYLRWAIEVMGIERIMFAVDYPFLPAKNRIAHRFLEEANLEAVDREKIASSNWDRLIADIRR